MPSDIRKDRKQLRPFEEPKQSMKPKGVQVKKGMNESVAFEVKNRRAVQPWSTGHLSRETQGCNLAQKIKSDQFRMMYALNCRRKVPSFVI